MDKNIKIQILQRTPLAVAARAIRTCWDSHLKGDSCTKYPDIYSDDYGEDVETEALDLYAYGELCSNVLGSKDLTAAYYHSSLGEKDKELIDRVGNKNKHSSTLEHIVFTFNISGISRACLMELTRHRMSSFSVKSTRYTLKEMKDVDFEFGFEGDKIVKVNTTTLNQFYTLTSAADLGEEGILKLAENAKLIQDLLRKGTSLDKVKFFLSESYKTSLVWTINLRSLQNFFKLRTSRSALREIRDLAYAIYNTLPAEYDYLFEGCIEDPSFKKGKYFYLNKVTDTTWDEIPNNRMSPTDVQILEDLIKEMKTSIYKKTTIYSYAVRSPIEPTEVTDITNAVLNFTNDFLREREANDRFSFSVQVDKYLRVLKVDITVYYKGENLEKEITLEYYNWYCL